MANDDNPRGLFGKLGEFLKRVFTGIKAEEPLPAEVPKSTDELRRLIIESERRGVDVNRAWRFYEQAKENKEAPEAEAKFIELAFNELSRKKELRRASTSALNYTVAIVFMALLVVVLWFLLRDERSAAVQLAIWSPLIVILYLIRGLISSGFKIASARGVRLELPEKPPETADELRTLIFEFGRKGVNVKRARALYEDAKKLEEANEPVKASLNVDKAYGDLSRKVVLFETSRGAFFVCIFALIIILFLFVGITKYHEQIESKEILRVPLFIVTWGLIGSMSYVLVSVYRKIRRRSFEWVDLAGYFYRFLLGGVLAGVSFYILQLGVTSLPGVAGEGVSAAVASGDEARDYREAFLKKEETSAAVKEYRRLIYEFESRDENNGPAELARFLIDNADGWEKYNPPYRGGRIVARGIEDKLRDYNRKDREFKKVEAKLGVYVSAVHSAIEEINTEEAQNILDGFPDTTDSEKLEYLKGNEGIWKGKVRIPGEGIEMTGLEIDSVLDEYDGAYDKQKSAAECITKRFSCIKDKVLTELFEKEGAAAHTLELYESKIRKWTGVFESVGLSAELPVLMDEVSALEVEIDTLDEEIWKNRVAADAEEKVLPSQDKLSGTRTDREKEESELTAVPEKLSSEERVLLGQDKIDRSKTDLEKKELELAAVREKLRAAAARDLARPFWEAPVFIVIAFLSGYSVEFVTRLFRRVEEMALREVPAKAEEAEPEEEGGEESEDEG